MAITTLRNWGGSVAVSLPRKVLLTLGLQTGSRVQVKVQDGNIVLAPARRQFTLEQLEREHRALERRLGRPVENDRWIESPARGRESL
jgi:antitoxin component of MazEF toxin-antitoxin module